MRRRSICGKLAAACTTSFRGFLAPCHPAIHSSRVSNPGPQAIQSSTRKRTSWADLTASGGVSSSRPDRMFSPSKKFQAQSTSLHVKMVDGRIKINAARQNTNRMVPRDWGEPLSGRRMLAIAYRNLIGEPTGPGKGIDRAVRQVFAQADRSARRKLQHFASESLVRDLLEVESIVTSSPWPLTRNRDGKPTPLASNGQSAIEVSISHSGPLALAGITNLGEIGVDV